MDPIIVLAKFEVRSFTRSWDNIAIGVLGGGCKPQSSGRWGRRGLGMVSFERALVSFYRPSTVTFPLSLRVSEILPLLCFYTPLFPTPPLVFSKFPHVPLGLGGWPWAPKSEGVVLSVRAISFKEFQPMWSWSTNVTDGRTDRRTDDMRWQYRAMHYSASRGKNRKKHRNSIKHTQRRTQ